MPRINISPNAYEAIKTCAETTDRTIPEVVNDMLVLCKDKMLIGVKAMTENYKKQDERNLKAVQLSIDNIYPMQQIINAPIKSVDNISGSIIERTDDVETSTTQEKD